MEETCSSGIAKLSVTVATFHILFSPPGESLSALGQVKNKTPNKERRAMTKDGEGEGCGANSDPIA